MVVNCPAVVTSISVLTDLALSSKMIIRFILLSTFNCYRIFKSSGIFNQFKHGIFTVIKLTTSNIFKANLSKF